MSFAVAAALRAGMRLPALPAVEPAAMIQDLREGWREFTSRRRLWVLSLQMAVIVAVSTATADVLGPLVAGSRLGGARSWGRSDRDLFDWRHRRWTGTYSTATRQAVADSGGCRASLLAAPIRPRGPACGPPRAPARPFWPGSASESGASAGRPRSSGKYQRTSSPASRPTTPLECAASRRLARPSPVRSRQRSAPLPS